MHSTFKFAGMALRRHFASMRSSPAVLIICLLIPLMLLELVGIAAEGRKRYPSFEGAMFVVWAWLLSRYRFSPSSVFLLFGMNGVLAELLIGGPALLMAPFWIFIYGLMIFLPAYSFCQDNDA
jgi:hypothetical protein